MFNAFLKYERDFRAWVDADFPGIHPLSWGNGLAPNTAGALPKLQRKPANTHGSFRREKARLFPRWRRLRMVAFHP